MAKRIVYIKTKKAPFYKELEVDFAWIPCLNNICRSKCIMNLLTKLDELYSEIKALDVSYISGNEKGVILSSLEKPITLTSEGTVPVESFYPSSKLFNHINPNYLMLDAYAVYAKDVLSMTVDNTYYLFDNKKYATDVLPFFYDWLFCQALNQNMEFALRLLNFDAYCSIMSPVKSIKCEARAAAIYEGLRTSGQLPECLANFAVFFRTLKGKEISEMIAECGNSSQIGPNDSAIIYNSKTDCKTAISGELNEISSLPVKYGLNIPTAEKLKKILSNPVLTKVLANTGAVLGISGTVRERANLAVEQIVLSYHQVLIEDQLKQNDNNIIFSVDHAVTVELTPNKKVRYGWQVVIHINQESAASHIIHNDIENKKKSSFPNGELTPAMYAKERGFNVISVSKPEPTMIIRLAHQIQNVCKTESGNDFFLKLRKSIHVTKQSNYKLADTIDKNEKKDLITLLYEMKKLGLFCEASFNQKTNCITYSLPDVEKIRQFLMGRWLECAFYDDVKRIVSEFAESYRLPAHVVGNLKLSQNPNNPNTATHELDVAFTLGDLFFACEAKTGTQVDYDRFRIVGKDLDILPDRLILINSSLSSKEAEAINWWYPYHVVAGADLESALRNMILDVLKKAGYKLSQASVLQQQQAA